MLTVEQMKEKLFAMPEKFDKLCKEDKWSQAKHVYDNALTISVFMELDLEDRIKLFGNRPYRTDDEEELIDGMFPEWRVQRAYRESFKKDTPVAWKDKPFQRIKKGS